jgi:hypothetical protein
LIIARLESVHGILLLFPLTNARVGVTAAMVSVERFKNIFMCTMVSSGADADADAITPSPTPTPTNHRINFRLVFKYWYNLRRYN